MTMIVATNVLKRANGLRADDMDAIDQMKYIASGIKFAEDIKPIVDKYAPEEPQAHEYSFVDGKWRLLE